LNKLTRLKTQGKQRVRLGLVIVLTWIGALKFTAYEAMGIQSLVAYSPVINWLCDFLSVRSFSAMLGCIEIGTAALLSLRYVSPMASAAGSVLGIGLFATTLSMLFTTPGWESSLGFPALRAMPDSSCSKTSRSPAPRYGRWANRSRR
jgi:reactive chlorine resistance protein C